MRGVLVVILHTLQILIDLARLVNDELAPENFNQKFAEESGPLLVRSLVKNLIVHLPDLIIVGLDHVHYEGNRSLAADDPMGADHEQDCHLVTWFSRYLI